MTGREKPIAAGSRAALGLAPFLSALILAFLCGIAPAASTLAVASPADSGMVRLRVDHDAVTLEVDDLPVETDLNGSRLSHDEWFVFSLPSGFHTMRIEKTGYIAVEEVLSVLPDTVATIEVLLEPVVDEVDSNHVAADSSDGRLAKLRILSDPAGATAGLAGYDGWHAIPTEMVLPDGTYDLSVRSDGYETLDMEQRLGPGQELTLQFVLREQAPLPQTPQDLGLEYPALRMLLLEEEADVLRTKLYNLGISFTIIPLGQGLLAKSMLQGSARDEADVLILSGIVLSSGSFLLGHLLSTNRRASIRQTNTEIEAENARLQGERREIDVLVRSMNAEALEAWQSRNQDRGRVETQEN